MDGTTGAHTALQAPGRALRVGRRSGRGARGKGPGALVLAAGACARRNGQRALTHRDRVPVGKRSLRTARETLLRTAPALEGPRLVDLGSEEKLKNILRDRQAFHSFEDQLRLSMEKALFHKRVQTAHATMEGLIQTQRASPKPAALKRGRVSPMAQRLAVRCLAPARTPTSTQVRDGWALPPPPAPLRTPVPSLHRILHRSSGSDSCRTT